MLKSLKNQKGNAIIAVLMGTIGVVAVSYMTLQRASINSKINIKNKADKDLDDVAMKVGTYFLSPANCNANFYNKPVTGSLAIGQAISLCPSGNSCSNNGTPITSVASGALPVFDPTSTEWRATHTGISDRVRVVGVSWAIPSGSEQKTIWQGGKKAGILRVNVTFQKNLGFVNSTRKTVNIVRSFDAFVVHATFDIGAAPTPPHLVYSATLFGCAWAPNSTNVYQN